MRHATSVERAVGAELVLNLPSCTRSRLAAGEVEYIVQVLLRAFHSSLLQTYKSKFTQVRKALHCVCD